MTMINDIYLGTYGNFSTNVLQVKHKYIIRVFGFGHLLLKQIMQNRLALIILNNNVPFSIQREFWF